MRIINIRYYRCVRMGIRVEIFILDSCSEHLKVNIGDLYFC